MSQFKFIRDIEMPAAPEVNALYMIRDAVTGKLSMVAVDDNGVVAAGLTAADVEVLIESNFPETVASADKLSTARKISSTGDATWEVSFNGSADATAEVTLTATGVTAGEYAVVTVDAKGRVTTARALAATDLPAELTSNAATATALATARTINGVDFDGTADIVINAVDSTARIAASEKGAANGVATLDDAGLVPASQLPSFVDDVIEVDSYDQLPGEENEVAANGAPSKGKIYVVAGVEGTKIYRWSGTAYIQIPSGVGTSDSAVKLATARSITATGDATWTVSFDGTADVTAAITLADTGVVAGTYAGITVDAKGRVTSARALVQADIPQLDHTTVISAASVVASGSWES